MLKGAHHSIQISVKAVDSTKSSSTTSGSSSLFVSLELTKSAENQSDSSYHKPITHLFTDKPY